MVGDHLPPPSQPKIAECGAAPPSPAELGEDWPADSQPERLEERLDQRRLPCRLVRVAAVGRLLGRALAFVAASRCSKLEAIRLASPCDHIPPFGEWTIHITYRQPTGQFVSDLSAPASCTCHGCVSQSTGAGRTGWRAVAELVRAHLGHTVAVSTLLGNEPVHAIRWSTSGTCGSTISSAR